MKRQLVNHLLFLLICVGWANAQTLSTICGSIVDTNGNPVANHQVTIMGDTATNPTNFYYSTQTTNSQGFFCDTVPYNFTSAYSFIVWTTDCQGNYQSLTVNLNNQSGQVTLTICAPNTNVFNAVICGTVTDLSGSPIANQSVSIDGDISLNPQNTHSSTVVTDANGNYCDSVYFAAGTHDRFKVSAFDCNQQQVITQVNMNLTSTGNLQICRNIQSGCQICGVISSSNTIVNTDSSMVYLIQYDPTTQLLTAIDSTMSFTTNPNSPNYCFYNVVAGNYLVKAAMTPANPAYASHLPTYYGNSLLWSSAQTITVCPSVNNANILFIAGNNPGGPGFIGGLVTQGANKTQNTALVGATVILKDVNGNNIAWSLTDGNGAYQFPNLAYGTYHIWVDALNLYSAVKIVTISATTPNSTGNDIEMNLNPAGINELDMNVPVLEAYPNPANKQLNIQLSADMNTTLKVELLSLTGAVILQDNWVVNAGVNQHQLNLENCTNGAYLLKVSDTHGSRTLKVILAK